MEHHHADRGLIDGSFGHAAATLSMPASNTFVGQLTGLGADLVAASTGVLLTAAFSRSLLIVQLQHVAQPQSVTARGLREYYDGFWQAVKELPKRENNKLAWWRGSTCRIAQFVGPKIARGVAHLIAPYWNRDTFTGRFSLGVVTGVAGMLWEYPWDVVYTKLTIDVGPHHEYSGIRDVFAQIWNTNGIVGFYRGFSAHLLGMLVYRLSFFGSWALVHSVISPHLPPNTYVSFLTTYAVTQFAGSTPFTHTQHTQHTTHTQHTLAIR
eukprot:TRINITY_DN5554_c0_g1_i1.p1 TRINITY_DN5554_c0_g1~~TRINITY_DN5554_c0_g1_i1.p1  ORF type:complete len:278 (-),score=45.22 TRINITY_DN5554_c0_g1_i1:23-823(-)